MTWGVFYRPSQYPPWDTLPSTAGNEHQLTFIREYAHHDRHTSSPPSTAPQFRTPLSASVLNDPAFSSDPRSHPHFPITNARSFKQLPSKSPRNLPRPLRHSLPFAPEPGLSPSYASGAQCIIDPPSVVYRPPAQDLAPSPASPSSESKSSTALSELNPPTVSSFTSQSHECRTPSPVALSTSQQSPSSTELPVQHDPGPPSPPSQLLHTANPSVIIPDLPAQEIRQSIEMPSAPKRADSTPFLSDRKKRAIGKGRMKHFFLPFTKRPDLDRIDELDETDPFRGGFHHAGPYEAIASNLAELGPPHMYSDINVLRGDFYNSKCQTATPLGHVKDQSPLPGRRPPAKAECGLLNVDPGQIPRRNMAHEVAVHNAPPNITPNPNLSRRKPAASITRPVHLRSQSLPNHPTHSCEAGSSSDPRGHAPISLEDRSSPATPRVHYFGDNIPNIPNNSASKIDGNPAAYSRHYRHAAPVLPPNRHEATSRSPSPPPPSSVITAQTQPISADVIDVAGKGSRHKSVRSLDSTPSHKTGSTQASSNSQSRTLSAPRIHHRPKRLIMPAPLQPQVAALERILQPQYTFPQAGDHEDYQDHLRIGSGQAGETPAMHNAGRKVLRKKSSAFPANVPLPVHAPMRQADAAPAIGGSSRFSVVHEAERIKEEPRRRKLSKRKNDG
ncbi:hypothetical protein F5I97DRAFT_2024512 [Phlebopus sp. FC_14]|nr:hypothetical protein F5I97DRAFT_2024512 [Phlebopus sp. FC_14]